MVGLVKFDDWLWVEKKVLETPLSFFLDDTKDSVLLSKRKSSLKRWERGFSLQMSSFR